MSTLTVVKDAKKYEGQYVTVKSFASKAVITHGKQLLDVFKRAQKAGVEEPVLIYIPGKDAVHLF
jgi:hypothetical protein